MTRSMWLWLTVLAALLPSCLDTSVTPRDASVRDPAPRDATPDATRDTGPDAATSWVAPGVRAFDAQSREVALDALPRRVRLELEVGRALTAPEQSVWLLRGAPDAALLDDLREAPLRSETLARVLPARISAGATGAHVEPIPTLDRGATLTLAIAAWATGASGLRVVGGARIFALAVRDDPQAGARVVDVWPPDGRVGVGTDLARVVVRFDGEVREPEGGLRLVADAPIAARITRVACEELGFGTGTCVQLAPSAPLMARARVAVETTDALRDATGAAIDPWRGAFTIADGPDTEPPSPVALPCALDETPLESGGCVLADDGRVVVRTRWSEPVRVEALGVFRVAPRGDAAVSVGGLSPDAPLTIALVAHDASERTTRVEIAARTQPALPRVWITEVRADPLGTEPRQEYVEIFNDGAQAVDLTDFQLSDRADAIGDALPAAVLAPGARALLVSDAFDPDDTADVRPPPGAPLIHLGASIGTSGLSNEGETLFLRDAEGHRLSAAPALKAPAGMCVIRTQPGRSGDPGAFTIARCTPGAPDA